MNSWRKLLDRLSGRADRDLDREIQAHLDLETEEHGRAAARRALGNATLIKETTRETWGWTFAERLAQDLRYAFRRMKRDPGVTAVVVAVLALGIGANTAIFSLVDAVLLKSLPVNHPEQLVALTMYDTRGRSTNFSHPMFERIRDGAGAFTGMFAAEDGTYHVEMQSDRANAEIAVEVVSPEYFRVLGTPAFAGRVLAVEDAQAAVVVLNHAFWLRRFAGDPAIVGKQIRLQDTPFTVIGVAAAGFFGETLRQIPDAWAPLAMQPRFDRGRDYVNDASTGWLRVMARLRPGISEEQARAAVAVVLAQVKAQQDLVGRRARAAGRIEVSDGSQGLADMRERYAMSLRILMAGVALVLAIACANLANLLLARAAARRQEVAIRLAIGAGRARLIRQFLTESLLLALAGGVAGWILSWWGSRALLVLAGGVSGPLTIDVAPNLRILGFTLAVALGTGVLFGLAPAWSITKAPHLRARAPRVSWTRGLVVSQVALTLLLLTCSGLLTRTLRNLRAVDLGFASERVLQVGLKPEATGFKGQPLNDLLRLVKERVGAMPGVVSTAMSGNAFGTGNSETCCIAVEGYVAAPGEDRQIRTMGVTSRYFQTMGIPLVLGRDFEPHEAGADLVILNESAARKYFGTTNPVGKRLGWGDPPKVNYKFEIIGVARNANYGRLREPVKPLLYAPVSGDRYLTVRTAGDPAALGKAIRAEIQAVDHNLEIRGMTTVIESLEGSLTTERLLARLSAFFGVLALLLAATGLYGLMAYTVARRVPEIGIRMALGARRPGVLWMILRQTFALVAVGLALGVPASLAAARLLSAQLFEVKPGDPATLPAAAAALFAFSALAGYIPARRASRVDPMIALRHE